MLFGFLERQRATLEWKCSGLDVAGLRATTAASSMTLGGLLKHLAQVEDDMAFHWLNGRELPPPWDDHPDLDWAWSSSSADAPALLFEAWRESVSRSQGLLLEAFAEGGLDRRGTGITNAAGEAPTLRYILLTLIEEYARHVGHADLLRESVDGLTGE